MDKQVFIDHIGQFSQGRVMVVGDVAIDEMIYGEATRISREAPVLILHHRQTDILLGAGANAAHNLSKLGAQKITMVGTCGKDYYCSLLFEALERDGISQEGIVQDDSRPTTTKSRISGQSRQSVMQQIVRIDRESDLPITEAIESQVIARIQKLAPHHDALIISDYKLGVITDSVIAACIEVAKQHGLLLAVDSHRDLACFPGASIATPNQPEAEANVGGEFHTRAELIRGGLLLKDRAQLANLLITQGKDGMTLFEADGRITHIPAFNKSEVFDVTGAGDTVIATLTLAMATGCNPLDASVLGNLAASIVVKRYATATTTPTEMIETLNELEQSLFTCESTKTVV